MSGTDGSVRFARRDGTDVVALRGEIDLANADGIEARVRDRLPRAAALAIDLTEVAYLDSSGVQALDRLVAACAAAARPVRVVAPPGTPARATLALCSFPDHVLAGDLGGALIALGAPRPPT